MNGEFKRYIYIIGTILMVFLVGSIVLHILPWILITGLIIYVVAKVVGFIKGKTEKRNSNNFNNSNNNEYVYKDTIDEYTNGEVIDVEYEDVDNKDNE